MTQHTHKKAPSLRIAVSDLVRALAKDLFGAYRPERHYMRGPGPKWQEKHRRASRSTSGLENLAAV